MGSYGAAILTVVIAVAVFYSLAYVFKLLKSPNSTWTLADAVSEEADVSLPISADKPPVQNAEGNVATKTEMKASASRLIALLGLMAILMLYIGAGLTVLHNFALNGNALPGTVDVVKFMASGLVMFTPYAVNKITSIFQ